MSRGSAVLAVAALLVSVGDAPGPAWAQGAFSGPTISLERAQLQPGQRVEVTLSGWRSRNVTLSVCGNLARRGSADCNMVASQSVNLANTSAPTRSQLVVFAPPTTCPCVVRASSAAQEEVVFAPIELAGVAVGPVVGPVLESPVMVSAVVRIAEEGFIARVRSALGGPTGYRVNVTVRNLSAETLPNVSLTGSVGRSRTDSAVSFDIPYPGAFGPGQTWEHELPVILPAPVLNRSIWRVTAAGAGEVATVEVVTHRLPIGLCVLTAIFVADVVAMLWRFAARRVARRRRPATPLPDEVPLQLSVLRGGATVT